MCEEFVKIYIDCGDRILVVDQYIEIAKLLVVMFNCVIEYLDCVVELFGDCDCVV